MCKWNYNEALDPFLFCLPIILTQTPSRYVGRNEGYKMTCQNIGSPLYSRKNNFWGYSSLNCWSYIRKIEDKLCVEDIIVDSEVKNIIISVFSSGINDSIVLWLSEDIQWVTVGKAGAKEEKADSQCKNVIALHFIQMIPVIWIHIMGCSTGSIPNGVGILSQWDVWVQYQLSFIRNLGSGSGNSGYRNSTTSGTLSVLITCHP